jgi:hypothetical protein
MKNWLKLILILCICFSQWRCVKGGSDAAAFAPVNGQGGSLARFAISGNYLYTVDKEKLKVYNITDGANPVLKNITNVGFEIETIYPFKNRLFIGSTSVVHIFSIDDPENPQKLSTAISPEVLRRCDPVVAKDSVAYATLRTNGPCGGINSILAVYDIKNINKPQQVFSYPVGEPYGLGYSDTGLYVSDRLRGLMIFNISNAYQPVYVKSLMEGSFIDVIPYYNTLICWVTDGLFLYDITDPLSPKFTAKII